MSIDARFGALVIAALVASPTACLAQAGVIGCNELPEYDRAVGTIENGDESCGMTTAEANRILAQHEAATRAATQPVVVPVAPRHYHHRHHKRVAPPM